MTARPYIPQTTPLFVPATRPERFAKAAVAANTIIIDLEDAVPADSKDQARQNLAIALPDAQIIVRINAVGTPWHGADVAALQGLDIAAVMLAKAESPADLANLGIALGPSVGIVPLIESAAGLANARMLAAAAGVVQLAFGSIDYCADLGISHTRLALLSARSELVLASRLAARAAPLDGVTTRIDDAALVEDDARHAQEIGFGGKLCIHPAQLGPARLGFAPTDAELAWAEAILASGEDGAVAVDGAMVDAPVRQRARALLARRSPG